MYRIHLNTFNDNSDTFRYTSILFNTLKYISILMDTLKYMSILMGTLEYFCHTFEY